MILKSRVLIVCVAIFLAAGLVSAQVSLQPEIQAIFSTEEAGDRDADGVENTQDACPGIPGQGSRNGCPQFQIRPYERQINDGIIAKIFPSSYSTQEKTHIRQGDFFKAIILNPRTEEILSESAVLEVRN